MMDSYLLSTKIDLDRTQQVFIKANTKLVRAIESANHHTHTHTYIYIYIYGPTYTYMHACIYVCICIHVQRHA